ncbi:MAG: hydroxyacid dehydrogenase [Spirochaetales bacterium]|nr:hydroxyacid dehydrogenase [Spirochaetales bacterium]
MNKVLVDRPLHPDAHSLLSANAEVLEVYDDDRTRIEAALRVADGVICSAALKMFEKEISIAGRLKVIGRPGVGYDSVDVAASSRQGIPLVYTPDGPTESVAEHVIMMMLMAAKRINTVQKAFREDGDFGIRTRVTGTELLGKTLGLIGFGRIGRRTAEIASRGLGMKILVHDPFIGSFDDEAITASETLEQLLRISDIISVHIPFSEENRNLIGFKEFSMMKQEAVFINTARGGVVDEEALIDALQTGKIASAGLDVYQKEPPDKDNLLLKLENVIATPHLSSFTDDGKRKMGMMVVEGVLDVLSGKKPQFIVNPEVWERRRR